MKTETYSHHALVNFCDLDWKTTAQFICTMTQSSQWQGVWFGLDYEL